MWPLASALPFVFCGAVVADPESNALDRRVALRALTTAPTLFEEIRPMVEREFKRRMSLFEPEVNVSGCREALRIFSDPREQATLLRRDEHVVEQLRRLRVTPEEFTEAVSLAELAMIRLRFEIDKQALRECIAANQKFVRSIEDADLKGAGLAQWELALYQEQRLDELHKSSSLDSASVERVGRYKDILAGILSGCSAADWLGVSVSGFGFPLFQYEARILKPLSTPPSK